VTTTQIDQTREAWLRKAVLDLSAILTEVGEEVPPIHVSVGWPGGRGKKATTVGQCWSRSSSADQVNQIFMSPVRGEDETRDVLGTLLHEMIHAVDDCESGHRGNFARIARSVGFLTKLTSADNRTDELNERLDAVVERLGGFPHAAMVGGARGSEEKPKQTTRMIKLEAPCCGYVVRTSQKWIDEGLPSCPCGNELEVQ
jgi:hypothetical protein